ncbi:MAG: hypothetical protein GY856_40925, partial [bacterium]|nr:hypothetical protein [bacterium]
MQERSADRPAHRRSAVILWLWAALLCAVVLAVFQHLFLDSTYNWDFNAIRLQRCFALRAGIPLYPGRDSGVVLNTIYGPVGTLAFLPATLASRPAAAILIGQGISWLCFFLPMIVLHGWGVRRGGRKLWAVFGLLAFAALTADLRPLAYVAFSIHVDAPTLALVALACCCLLFFRHRTGWAHFIAAAVFTVLAVWSKQVALPLVVVLPAWVWLTEGWRRAVRFLVCLAVCGALISAVILWLFGPVENVLFNLWTVPRNQVTHPSGRMWDLVGAFRRHTKETALLGVLVVVTAVLELRRHAAQGSSGGRLRA